MDCVRIEDVEKILSRIQPDIKHKGKIAGAKGEQIQKANKVKELKEKLFVELFDQEVAKTLTRDDVFNSSYMISEGGVTVTRVNFRYYRVEVDPNCDYDIIYFSFEDFYDNNILPYTLEVALTPIPLMGIE